MENLLGTYTITQNITVSDVETVIVNCLEGGSNYWLGLDNSTDDWKERPDGEPFSMWVVKLLLDGKTVHFYDVEEESETFTLTLEQLLKGFQLNADKRPFDCDLENGDAITSDCILQYAMFGQLVYG